MDSENWMKKRSLPNVTHICSVNSLIRALVLVTSKTPIYPSWTLLCLQLYPPPFPPPSYDFSKCMRYCLLSTRPYPLLCTLLFSGSKASKWLYYCWKCKWVSGIALDAKILFTHNIGYTYNCSALLYFKCLSVHPLGAYLWTVPLAEKWGGGGGLQWLMKWGRIIKHPFREISSLWQPVFMSLHTDKDCMCM